MKKEIVIFFTIDNKFAKYCSVTIASILANSNSDENFIFGILSSDLSEKSKNNIRKLKKIKNFEIKFFNVDNSIFSAYDTPNYISSSASLYRYLIPNLSPEFDKVLYLDSDIIVKSSLFDLFNTDLKDTYIGGVEDFHWNMGNKRLKLNSNISEPYFNSGVLLINSKKWREENLFDKLIEQTKKLNPYMLEQTDQDAINIVCKNKKTVLDPKYNLLACFEDRRFFTSYSKKQMDEAITSPVIIHYSGPIKPWNRKCFPTNEFAYEYYKYLKFTPFYKKRYVFLLSLFNADTKKYLFKIKDNLFVQVCFNLIKLPIQIFYLFKSLFKFKKYYNKFKN